MSIEGRFYFKSCLALVGFLFLTLSLSFVCVFDESKALSSKGASFSAHSSPEYKPSMLIGNVAISSQEIVDKARLLILILGMVDNQTTIDKIKPKVIEHIYEEELQHNIIANNNISVSSAEVRYSLDSIDRANNLPQGSLERAVKERGIPVSILYKQIHIRLAWARYILNKYSNETKGSNEEVLNYLKKCKTQGVSYHIARIVLYVPNEKERASVKTKALSICKDLEEGLPFPWGVRFFSQEKPSLLQTDEWIFEEDLDPELKKHLISLNIGNISRPIQTKGAYTIVCLIDKKQKGDDASPSKDEILNILWEKKMEELSVQEIFEQEKVTFVKF